MKTTGMKMAASETVIDMTVKLISLAPISAATSARLALVKMAGPYFPIRDDGVIHQQTHGEGEPAISERLSRL